MGKFVDPCDTPSSESFRIVLNGDSSLSESCLSTFHVLFIDFSMNVFDTLRYVLQSSSGGRRHNATTGRVSGPTVPVSGRNCRAADRVLLWPRYPTREYSAHNISSWPIRQAVGLLISVSHNASDGESTCSIASVFNAPTAFAVPNLLCKLCLSFDVEYIYGFVMLGGL